VETLIVAQTGDGKAAARERTNYDFNCNCNERWSTRDEA